MLIKPGTIGYGAADDRRCRAGVTAAQPDHRPLAQCGSVVSTTAEPMDTAGGDAARVLDEADRRARAAVDEPDGDQRGDARAFVADISAGCASRRDVKSRLHYGAAHVVDLAEKGVTTAVNGLTNGSPVGCGVRRGPVADRAARVRGELPAAPPARPRSRVAGLPGLLAQVPPRTRPARAARRGARRGSAADCWTDAGRGQRDDGVWSARLAGGAAAVAYPAGIRRGGLLPFGAGAPRAGLRASSRPRDRGGRRGAGRERDRHRGE